MTRAGFGALGRLPLAAPVARGPEGDMPENRRRCQLSIFKFYPQLSRSCVGICTR
jgi:hypothetical protein